VHRLGFIVRIYYDALSSECLEIFLLFKIPTAVLRPTQFPIQEVAEFFTGCKAAGALCWPSSQSSAEVRNEWSYTSTPPVCLHGMGWDTFIVTFNLKQNGSNDQAVSCVLQGTSLGCEFGIWVSVIPRPITAISRLFLYSDVFADWDFCCAILSFPSQSQWKKKSTPPPSCDTCSMRYRAELNTTVLIRVSDRVTTCFIYLCDRHGESPGTTDCYTIIAANFWGVTKFMTNCGCSDHKL